MRSSRDGEKGQTSSMVAQIRRTQTKRLGRPRHLLEVGVWAASRDTQVSKGIRKEH